MCISQHKLSEKQIKNQSQIKSGKEKPACI